MQFNFGKNWQAYSDNFFDRNKLEEVKEHLHLLLGDIPIKGKTFLDIGSGSGIFSLAAKSLGAEKVIGFDISPQSVQCAKENAEKMQLAHAVEFHQASIFDVDEKSFGTFDIVYSWGVLHHTGDMWRAIERAMGLVRADGFFIIAIYNKHWSSLLWRAIKYSYNVAPQIIQRAMVYVFYAIIFAVKLVMTRQNPLQEKRGMNFYYDVVDWLGGYPYEYTSRSAIIDFFKQHGYSLLRSIPPNLPTGCNQFVFQKRACVA